MSSVVSTNTTSNVTHSSCKQANEHHSLTHHQQQYPNRGLYEKSSTNSNILNTHNNQNSNPNPNILARQFVENSGAFIRQLDSSEASCMRLNNRDSVILQIAGPGNNPGGNCHCLIQQQQPLQQQYGNYLANSIQSVANQGEPMTLNATESTSLSKCSTTVINSCHNTSNIATTATCTNNKGVKRANDSVEQQGQIPVVLTPARASKVTTPTQSSGNPTATNQKFSGESQAQNSEGEEGDLVEDDESTFDYEPVLIKILNEKKLALSNSPDVIKFLASFRELQQRQTKDNPQSIL